VWTGLPLKPSRGGFLRPFGCGEFIREFLLGHGPHGSPLIDPDIGAPQADTFYHYKQALLRETAFDRATRIEEKTARHEGRPIEPDEIDRLTESILARLPYKTSKCRYHSFVVYFANLRRLGWVEWVGDKPMVAEWGDQLLSIRVAPRRDTARESAVIQGGTQRVYRLSERGRSPEMAVLWDDPLVRGLMREALLAVLAAQQPPQ
jgi:hypothetical protein